MSLLKLVGVLLDYPQDALWQRDVDAGRLVAEFREIDIDQRPRPAAVLPPATQRGEVGWLWGGLLVVEQAVEVQQDRLASVTDGFFQRLAR